MVGLDIEPQTQVEEKPSRGPVCAGCGKPYKAPKEKGGCTCERHPARVDSIRPTLMAADRQAVALEGILTTLQAILKRMEAK